MKSVVWSVVLVVCSIVSGGASAADARVATWNLMRLGNGAEKSYAAVAAIAANVDIVAVQEVMNDKGLNDLKAALEARTKESWSVLASDPAGSRAYQESYGFVYRDSAVEYVEGAVSYLDRKNIFMRPPFSALFKSKNGAATDVFALSTVHIIYGKSAADRTPELAELGNYWTWLEQVYPGAKLMLMGDFNMPPTDDAFVDLKQHAMPLITSGASTLSATDGRYANLYDQVWVSKANPPKITSAGIVDYPKMIGWSHEKSRQHVSDHAPVMFQLGSAQLASTVQFVRPESGAKMAKFKNSPKAANQPLYVTTAEPSARSAAGPVRGNLSSHVYHRATGCPFYDRISAKNRVEFESEAAAQAQGYRLAGNCN